VSAALLHSALPTLRDLQTRLPHRSWSWATPLGSQQMQQMALDSFRSGMRDRNLPPNTKGVWSGAAPIHSYVMPHSKTLFLSTPSYSNS